MCTHTPSPAPQLGSPQASARHNRRHTPPTQLRPGPQNSGLSHTSPDLPVPERTQATAPVGSTSLQVRPGSPAHDRASSTSQVPVGKHRPTSAGTSVLPSSSVNRTTSGRKQLVPASQADQSEPQHSRRQAPSAQKYPGAHSEGTAHGVQASPLPPLPASTQAGVTWCDS